MSGSAFHRQQRLHRFATRACAWRGCSWVLWVICCLYREKYTGAGNVIALALSWSQITATCYIQHVLIGDCHRCEKKDQITLWYILIAGIGSALTFAAPETRSKWHRLFRAGGPGKHKNIEYAKRLLILIKTYMHFNTRSIRYVTTPNATAEALIK